MGNPLRQGRHSPAKDDERLCYVLMGPSGKIGCIRWMRPGTAALRNEGLSRIARRNPGAHIPRWVERGRLG